MTSESSTSAEHEPRDGAPPNDGPIGGPPGPSAETPTGLPDGADEASPLGTDEEEPEGDADPQRGEEAMPGIPTDGDPPAAS